MVHVTSSLDRVELSSNVYLYVVMDWMWLIFNC